MFKRELTLVFALFGILSIALFTGCGSSGGGGGGGGNSVAHAGAWLVLPDINNDMNFFIVSDNGAVTDSGLRADSVTYSEPTSDTFQMTIKTGPETMIVNGTFTSATTGTFAAYPGPITGTIKKVTDRSACLNIQSTWYMWLGEDGGAGSILPASAGDIKSEIYLIRENYFTVDATGKMTDTPVLNPPDTLEVTKGMMLCNGTGLDDLIVGYFETTDPGTYSSVKFVSIINDISPPSTIAEGLYDNDSGTPWPVGTVKLTLD